MGSTVDLLVWGADAEALADWAIDEIERCEQSWSRFRPTSELVALNAQAGHGAVVVSPRLWRVIERAHAAWEMTGGRYDPTVLAGLCALGYDRSFPLPASIPGGLCRASAAPGLATVGLHAATRTVVLPMHVGLDLGGIGKGYAADLVVEGLLARGAVSACVSLGGDVRVGGPGPDEDDAWEVTVEDPREERAAFVFPLSDEAIAQSSVFERRWTAGADPVHHLLDPRTGHPANTGVVCAVVTAPHTWLAESLAKAALIAGVEDGLHLLAGAFVDGWLLGADGTTHATPAVADSNFASFRVTS